MDFKSLIGRGSGFWQSAKGVGPIMLDLWAGLQTVGWVFWQLLKPIGKLSWKGLQYWPFWKRVFLHGSSVAFFLSIAFFLGLFSITRTTTPDKDVDLWSINRPASVTVLDKDGELIGIRGSHYGDPVPLDELPDYVVATFVSTEDRRFYGHSGFDLRGLARAALTNIRAGRMREGASTITQQLARNLFLSADKTVTRKLKELHLAIWLEARYSKEEILSLYLNRTYLGSGAYGVEAASQIYYNKSARELTLPEAALLAGLPKAPSTLSPTVNFEGAARRATEVIDNLVETKKIDKRSAALAKLAPPNLEMTNLNADFGYAVDHVLIQTANILDGINEDIVISTTLSTEVQRMAVAAVRETLTEETDLLGAEQAALIAFGNEGNLLAMVGGRSYDDSQFNRATQAMRQPGSVFKPFVFLAALENGMHTRTLFIDQPTIVEGWRPRNYTGDYRGPMRMIDAMAQSVNSVAVQVSETVGREKVIEAARRLGVTHKLIEHPSVALGSYEVTLNEITSSYLPFAREGLSATPYSLLRVENRQGELLYEYMPTQETDLFDKTTSQDMTHLMHQVMLSGTGRRASLGKRDAAGKTGTTNDWKDAWFVGYTAQMTAGTWVGNDENRSMEEVTGGTLPAQIWQKFMLAAHDKLEMKPLPGATPAKAGSEVIRLVEYYNGLSEDFRTASYAQQQEMPRQSRSLFNKAEETDPTTSNDQPEESKKKRGWWPFGQRG